MARSMSFTDHNCRPSAVMSGATRSAASVTLVRSTRSSSATRARGAAIGQTLWSTAPARGGSFTISPTSLSARRTLTRRTPWQPTWRLGCNGRKGRAGRASVLVGQHRSQRVGGQGDGAPGGVGVGEGVEHDEVVDDGLEAAGGDSDASLAELVGIGLALVADHVSLGGDDQGGRQPGELLEAGPQRGGGGLGPLGRVGGVLVPGPLHGVAAQVVAGG